MEILFKRLCMLYIKWHHKKINKFENLSTTKQNIKMLWPIVTGSGLLIVAIILKAYFLVSLNELQIKEFENAEGLCLSLSAIGIFKIMFMMINLKMKFEAKIEKLEKNLAVLIKKKQKETLYKISKGSKAKKINML